MYARIMWVLFWKKFEIYILNQSKSRLIFYKKNKLIVGIIKRKKEKKKNIKEDSFSNNLDKINLTTRLYLIPKQLSNLNIVDLRYTSSLISSLGPKLILILISIKTCMRELHKCPLKKFWNSHIYNQAIKFKIILFL